MADGQPVPLIEALELSRRLGMLGARPVDEVVDHARAFVASLRSVPPDSVVVDLGTGGGVPGLVVAWDRPDLRTVLVDRRATRIDHVRRLISRLGLTAASAHHVSAHAAAGVLPRPAAAVVTRGFGPPPDVLAAATPLLDEHGPGLVVVSEPPAPDPSRWPPELLDRFGLRRRPWPDVRVAVLEWEARRQRSTGNID